jgi:hypothetical protein
VETLKRTVTIPDNHQLKLDVTLPTSFPTGEVELILVVASKPNYINRDRQILCLAGRLKKSVNFSGDPLTLQRTLRDEWRD